MKLKSSFSLLFLVAGLAVQGVSQQVAQSKPVPKASAGATEQTTSEFVRNFETAVSKGCKATVAKDIRNPIGYCNCFAKAFGTRYTSQELQALDRAALSSSEAPGLIALMMSPEIKACRRTN